MKHWSLFVLTSCAVAGCVDDPPARDFAPLPADLLDQENRRLVALLYFETEEGPGPLDANHYHFIEVRCSESQQQAVYSSEGGIAFSIESFDLAMLDSAGFSCPEEAASYPLCYLAECADSGGSWACAVRSQHPCSDFLRGLNPFGPDRWEAS